MTQWVNLKVDVLKVIENFVEMYPYSAAECVVVESIANCLDAKATKIEISIRTDKDGKRLFRVVDNGNGMTQEEFEENYHALSVTSKVKGAGIGFAGVGSKLYLVFLAAGQSIITETKSQNFHAASKITIVGNEPKWMYIDIKTLQKTGTLYEVKLNEKDAKFLTSEKIVQIIQSHYNAILLGRYGNVSITFGGKPVQPWKPELVCETVDPYIFKIRGKKFQCYFWLAKKDLEERRGLEIVVFGKKIRDNQWFDLDYIVKPQFRNKITGQILADRLAILLTTNKCDIRVQAGPALWTSFRQKAYDRFSDWLTEINAIEEKSVTELDPHLEPLCKKIEKEINRLLKDPAFAFYNPFIKKQKQSVLIKSPVGDVSGEEVEGTQKTKGTFGGEGIGQGVEVWGSEEGKSIRATETGEKQGSLAVRRVRHGIAINLEDEPDNPKEAWLTPEAIVINIGHPVSTKCSLLGYPAWVQHILRCVFFILLDQNPPQTFNETVDKIRDFYLKWSTI